MPISKYGPEPVSTGAVMLYMTMPVPPVLEPLRTASDSPAQLIGSDRLAVTTSGSGVPTVRVVSTEQPTLSVTVMVTSPAGTALKMPVALVLVPLL